MQNMQFARDFQSVDSTNINKTLCFDYYFLHVSYVFRLDFNKLRATIMEIDEDMSVL